MATSSSPASNHIVLSPEQESIVQSTVGRIPVYKSDGTLFGYVLPKLAVRTPKEPLFTPEEIAEAERQMKAGAPGKPLAEVLANLRAKYGS
jgi:hypothetical protein